MTAGQEHIQKVVEWLAMEQQADRDQYRQRVESTPLSERTGRGVAWYPVTIVEEQLVAGDRLRVTIERTRNLGAPHQFTQGAVVRWFVNSQKGEGPQSLQAVVSYVQHDRMVCVLDRDELPDWIDDGKLGVDLLFDEVTYRKMAAGLSRVGKAEGNRLAELREALVGQGQPRFSEEPAYHNEHLNDSQNRALRQALAAQEVGLVHGPPGTGKTTTLVEIIATVVKSEKQTLVCAQSNAAVDLLAEKLHRKGLNVLRLGHPARVTEEALQHTLDHQLMGQSQYKEVKQARKQADEFRRMAYKYKRKFGRDEREQRRLLIQESKRVRQEADRVESYLLERVTADTQVFCSTLSGATHELLAERTFGTVFIDEAAQAIEPACWLAIEKANRVIMAGDHQQLPPTIKSDQAARAGLERTLFEQLALDKGLGVMLETQYRMHQQIMQFSSQFFYKGALQAHASVAQATLADLPPVLFVDTAGAGYAEEVNEESRSTFNPEEAQVLLKVLEEQLTHLADTDGLRVAVIAPYRAQVKQLNEEIPAFAKVSELSADRRLTVNTVDAFQGQERDIIVISLTRSNERAVVGFLADIRRMNVAMTRAKRHLLIVGDSATLGAHPFYESFVAYVTEIGAYHSVFEYQY